MQDFQPNSFPILKEETWKDKRQKKERCKERKKR